MGWQLVGVDRPQPRLLHCNPQDPNHTGPFTILGPSRHHRDQHSSGSSIHDQKSQAIPGTPHTTSKHHRTSTLFDSLIHSPAFVTDPSKDNGHACKKNARGGRVQKSTNTLSRKKKKPARDQKSKHFSFLRLQAGAAPRVLKTEIPLALRIIKALFPSPTRRLLLSSFFFPPSPCCFPSAQWSLAP